MIDKGQAIHSLKPEAEFVIRGDELDWLSPDIEKPSEEEINAEVIRLEEIYNSQEYARQRKVEYPDLAEQLDYIYHNGITKWKSDIIKPIKDKYPK